MSENSVNRDEGELKIWEYPTPPGLGGAYEQVTGVAAPLLAGFSIVLTGVVCQASDAFRWPGWALVCLVAAAIFLVASLQCGFWAKGYLYSVRDLQGWRPGPWAEFVEQNLVQEQVSDYGKWNSWKSWASAFYRAGIVILAVGVGFTVAPPVKYGHGVDAVAVPPVDADLRWTAMWLAFAAAIGEVAWVVVAWWKFREDQPGQESCVGGMNAAMKDGGDGST
ncbi:hypothetical protein [Kitasatospora sp. Ki12]